MKEFKPKVICWQLCKINFHVVRSVVNEQLLMRHTQMVVGIKLELLAGIVRKNYLKIIRFSAWMKIPFSLQLIVQETVRT